MLRSFFISLNKRKLTVASFSKVEGMAMELTLGLKDQNGTLSLSLLDWGCFVKDIFVKLDGGATWFYQGYAVLLYNLILFEK